MNGQNLAGFNYLTSDTKSFKAINPATGAELDGDFYPANEANIDEAMQLATQAFTIYKNISKDKKAAFLRSIADELDLIADEMVARASAESGLTVPRLKGEHGRTTGQLKLFANLVEEGSWLGATIDSALPDRQPATRPDIRKMMVPLGPVVVFGASNFPFAFSVAGGDTASALASGCPVVVKAHSAHPGTSALVGEAILKAAQKSNMPNGVFSLLYDSGYTVGEALVKHPQTKAVTFTGSFAGGMALERLSQQRSVPIPVFAEMGSVNPVILFPAALESRSEEIAKQYAASITLGAGQFCTNPGLLLAIESKSLQVFEETLASAIANIPPATMLTPGIYKNFTSRAEAMVKEAGVKVVAEIENPSESNNQAAAIITKVTAVDFLKNPKLHEEVFGPYSLLVTATDKEQLKEVVEALQGQLTVTLIADKEELPDYQGLIEKAAAITGRIILNGVPTGVEVCAAMQHGGPFPATTDSRFTSVGTSAIHRFVRPLSWQNWEPSLLPDELKDGNPLNIWRLVDQEWTKN